MGLSSKISNRTIQLSIFSSGAFNIATKAEKRRNELSVLSGLETPPTMSEKRRNELRDYKR